MYVRHIDELVADGIFAAIECSLRFLLNNTDPVMCTQPFLELTLELEPPLLVFKPSLEPDDKSSLMALVDGLICDVFSISTLIPRLDKNCEHCHYQVEMEEQADLIEMCEDLRQRVHSAAEEALQARLVYQKYTYLWTDDRKEVLRQFLHYGCVIAADEVHRLASISGTLMVGDETLTERPPTIGRFREQVDSYERVCNEVLNLETETRIHGWLRLDTRLAKASLLNIAFQWSFMLKEYLLNHVSSSLNDLEVFIDSTELGISQHTEPDDLEGLLKVMGHLRSVRERKISMDDVFQSLKDTLEMLQTYGQEMLQAIHQQLEVLPGRWVEVQHQAGLMRQHLAPLQAEQVAILRKKCNSCEMQQLHFRQRFQQKAPFRYDCVEPYNWLDLLNQEMVSLEETLKTLIESSVLFEVGMPDGQNLELCRYEACLLKDLWDIINMVRSSLAAWFSSPWKKQDLEALENMCRHFANELRNLDKETRAWDAFLGLQQEIKTTLAALSVLSELQSPAIRDHHWLQLTQATGTPFSVNQDTTLEALLGLRLHEREDLVWTIVDRAGKEMAIEKVLHDLEITWGAITFQFDQHSHSDVPLLHYDEELIETLEDNQLGRRIMHIMMCAIHRNNVKLWDPSANTRRLWMLRMQRCLS
uniref:Dynein heavy chain linker domain-containing protein n=2 Tax=Eptatretus burgeri TaxID=7764 RepID=A0A8C4NHX8_EPTBU